MRTEFSPDGICVDVFDTLPCRRFLEDVAVVAAALLPETIFHAAIGPGDAESAAPLRILRAEESDRGLDYGLFDRLEDVANVVILPLGVDQDVNVFRHDHVGPDREGPSSPGTVQGFDEPGSSSVAG